MKLKTFNTGKVADEFANHSGCGDGNGDGNGNGNGYSSGNGDGSGKKMSLIKNYEIKKVQRERVNKK